MIANPGISELAWSFLMDRIRTASTLAECDRIERSVTLVHGEKGGAVKTIRQAIDRRRAELEAGIEKPDSSMGGALQDPAQASAMHSQVFEGRGFDHG